MYLLFTKKELSLKLVPVRLPITTVAVFAKKSGIEEGFDSILTDKNPNLTVVCNLNPSTSSIKLGVFQSGTMYLSINSTRTSLQGKLQYRFNNAGIIDIIELFNIRFIFLPGLFFVGRTKRGFYRYSLQS